MAFIHLIYFYIVLLSFLINPKEATRNSHERPRKSLFSSSSSSYSMPSSPSSSSTPAISAVLLECPKVKRRRESTSHPDCERQMMVHIRVSPSFQVETLDKFLLLDEAYDQRRQARAKLMSPYLIEISRGEPVVMYPLEFSKSVRCDTCGGGQNNNNTGRLSEENCEHPMDGIVTASATSDNQAPLTASTNTPSPPSPTNNTKSARKDREQRQKLQNQQNTKENEVPMGNGHNPENVPLATTGNGRDTAEKIDLPQRFAIGVLESNHLSEPNKQANFNDDMRFSFRDIPLRNQDEDKMDYDDVDEYDELNVNDDVESDDDILLGLREGRFKRLKPQHYKDPSLFSTQIDDALEQNEKLFEEAEKKGEQARVDTLRTFAMKHGNDKLLNSFVGPVSVAGYGATAGNSWIHGEKPHVVGIHEDSIRPQGAFTVDEYDDFETDASYGKIGLIDGKSKPSTGLQQKIIALKHERDSLDSNKLHGSKLKTAFQNSHARVTADKHSEKHLDTRKGSSVHTKRCNKGSNIQSTSAEKESLPLASTKSFAGESSSLPKDQPHTAEMTDNNKETIQKGKFSFTKNNNASSLNTQRFDDASSSDNEDDDDDDDDDDKANDQDYERMDSSVPHASAAGSVKSNITTKTYNSETVAGGMGDEFYWNTLHYPSANSDSKHKAHNSLHDYKISDADKGKFVASLDYNTPRKVTKHVKLNGNVINKYQDYKNKRKNTNGRQTVSILKAKDAKLARHSSNGYGSNIASPRKTRRGRYFDNSVISANRMKIRRSDGRAGFGGGVVETSGLYNRKDGIVPAFPLNGYPGYVNLKTQPESVPFIERPSQYLLLQNVPQEYIPHQPPYAKQISDPHLTLKDKISLIEILKNNDEDKDESLKVLEDDLDNSVIVHDITNPDRMPLLRIGRNKLRKNIQKRSFLTYDDLTVRDTDQEYDDINEKQPFYVPQHEEDDQFSKPEKCPSCSDEKCSVKREGEHCICDRHGRHCECSNLKPEKKIRSVSDAWYSVFNMSAPLQFLTTRVAVYRKRHGTWWKTAPSITLTSLSGIYASENLSILFSSHVDIFQLKRPITLQNHKLLVPHFGDSDETPAVAPPVTAGPTDDKIKSKEPHPYQFINPEDILVIDSSKFDFNKIHDDSDGNSKGDDQTNEDIAGNIAKTKLCEAADPKERQRKRRYSLFSNDEPDTVLSLGDFGFFPTSMNILEHCPSDPNHLCLNLLEEEAPAFTVKIKQPFLQNALFVNGDHNVRIISVISDATTKGALQVAVVIINEHFVINEFMICICECPITCEAKTTVTKSLAPHVSETVSFLLPLSETRDRKSYCNVEVKSSNQKVISKRRFIVEPTARCLCIWDCDCHCIQDLVSQVDYDFCHKLAEIEEQSAGFIEGGVVNQNMTGWRWFWWKMNFYAFCLLLFMLFLGFLKAVVGALCLRQVDRWGYDYVQPLKKYDNASRCRRFFINVLFFVVLPFICCCKCFTPTEEDFLMASTEWECTLIQHDYNDDSGDGDGDGDNGMWKKSGPHDNNDDDDEETILRLSQSFESGREGGRFSEYGDSQSRVSMSEFLLSACEFDDDEEERDKNFVLQALSQSRESIKMLLKSHCSEKLDNSNPESARIEDLVRKLVDAKIVYRIFDKPMQHVDVPPGQKYSIQGYFIPSFDSSYQFIAPSPVFQYRRIKRQSLTAGYTTDSLELPIQLRAEHFQRAYRNKMEVFKAGDLSGTPPEDAPCINSSNTTNLRELTSTEMVSLLPADNDVATEHVPAVADDTTTRNEQADDGSNGSDLTAKQKGTGRVYLRCCSN